MMKRMVIVIAVMAVVVPTVYGRVLINVPPLSTAAGATSQINSLSQDVLYVGGNTTDPWDGKISAAYYNLSTSTWTTVPNSAKDQPLSGDVTGVAHVKGGAFFFASGNMNDNYNRTYGTSNQFGRWYNGTNGGTFTPSSNTMTGNANLKTYPQPAGQSGRSTADGTDSWVTGFHSQGTTTKGNEGYIWKGSGGGGIYTTVTGRNSNSKVTMCGVASTGRAVGYDSATAARTAGYVNAVSGSTQMLAVGLVPGYNAAQNSYGWGISEDGNYITGTQVTTSTTRPQGFLWKVGDPSATLLPDLNGTVNNNNYQSYCDAVADDGTVVGYSWYSGLSKNAAIWLPGATKAQLLWDVAVSEYIDLTGWTTLGTGAAAIEKHGSQYYVAGNGTYNGYARGYVLVFPEPATLAFLALGGLAMLRRRR